MKKVGIITLFGIRNYGNRLQEYALAKTIEKLNCKPIEIIFCKKYDIFFIIKNIIKVNGLLTFISSFLAGIFSGDKLKTTLKKCNRLSLFSKFSRKTKKKFMFGDSDKFDYYVCGSDQIWNPNFAGNDCYFAKFADKKKRISYAASFGISELPEEVTERYRENLDDIKYISVRERAGAQIVNQLIGKETQIVIDPTLMLEAKEWHEVSEKPKFDIQNKYILAYFLGDFSGKTAEYVNKISKENDLEIILLHMENENDYWHYTGPSEFIWLIENASLVCTDSFHASVFSILMDSPFIVFRREYENNDMHSRIESLLEMFKLTDRFSENIYEGDELKKEYQHTKEILRYEREKATKFLTEALNLKDKRGKYD